MPAEESLKSKFDGRSLLADVLGVAGLSSLFYGCYSIYAPAGFIVLGVCLILLAYINSKG